MTIPAPVNDLTKEELCAMDGRLLNDALLGRVAQTGDLADEAIRLTTELAKAETILVFAAIDADKKAAKAEVIRLKAEIKCNAIRKQALKTQITGLQTSIRAVPAC